MFIFMDYPILPMYDHFWNILDIIKDKVNVELL